MTYCEQICATCPFRRDSERLQARPVAATPAQWYAAACGLAPTVPPCAAQDGALCLGWAVHMRNRGATSIAATLGEDIYDWVWSWAPDEDLIFYNNAEFINYHKGEHFGSMEWREEWKERFAVEEDQRADRNSRIQNSGEEMQLDLFGDE